MDNEEYERAIAIAYTDEEWVSIYNKLFGDLPDNIFGDNWGDFPIEKVIDAVLDKRRLPDKPLKIAQDVVL